MFNRVLLGEKRPLVVFQFNSLPKMHIG
uniref:Uncharacterized protein n=1 Tax=Anguilla anguilla TaxID=7936 RepID=A0A0E9Q299_ANGAN